MPNDPFFWLGIIGLILTILSGLVLLYQLRRHNFWLVLPIWLVVVMASSLLVHPMRSSIIDQTVPHSAYLFRVAVGVCFTVRAWYWNHQADPPNTPRENKMIRNILRYGVMAATIFVSYLAYKLRNAVK